MKDLRAVYQIVKDIYPVVANPYTLLTALRETYQWFTVLDLKDAFFCVPLEKETRKLFAFEWENPQTGQKMQLTWTRLPQGFKNSPTIFGNHLAKEFEIWKQDKPRPGHLFLQYVDDILIVTKERFICIQVTIDLLNFLGLNGYKVSRKKAQIACQTVIYLGFEILKGQRQLGKKSQRSYLWYT